MIQTGSTRDRGRARVAIVTGGARGIGFAIASALAAEGNAVVLASRSAPEVEAAVARLHELGRSAVGVTADVSIEADVERLVRATTDRLGPPEILVNNAAIQGPIGPTDSTEVSAWVATLHTNLVGPFLCSRAVIPHMRMLGRGKIVNVAGGGATGSRPFFSAYAASKAALVRFTECLADELRADNIQVNAISPGPARTAMTREILIAGPIAGERSLSEALEVERGGGVSLHLPAALVVFLTSPSADRVTGRLVSAIWDDWQAWAINPDSIDQALGTEGGTLRRVKPAQTGGYHH